MIHRASLLLGLVFVLALSVAAFGHTGETFFSPEVPDPSTMIMDGDVDDWGWMDPDWAETIDNMNDYKEEGINKDTYDCVWYTAWSRPPDNAFYHFTRVQDDTLRVGEEEQSRWWNDDMLQPCFDADHSGGGSYIGTEVGHIEIAQRYHSRILPLAGQSPNFLGQLDRVDAPDYAWSTWPPYMTTGWTLLPSGASHMSENVTYTMEWKFWTWDFHGPTPEESERHVFDIDQVIHFWSSWGDGDGGEYGQKNIYTPGTSLMSGATDEDQMPDFWMLECDAADCSNVGKEGAATAVEHTTWARIKSLSK
jgi:hypothetical protein